ncbi:hypothetical protein [Microcystis aeruginosa]|jgi:hypothetical protein|nr:kawaguchipeptin biosynthesis protein [Microcystis aeruginosa NIES-88]BCU10716.1 hypothetical protein MAN88_12800 [Microcystis aeruginosa]
MSDNLESKANPPLASVGSKDVKFLLKQELGDQTRLGRKTIETEEWRRGRIWN